MTTEEQEFQELLQDKRHKEIIKSLSTIAMALNSDEKSDDEIVKAIKKAKSLANEIALFNLKLSVKSKNDFRN